MYEWLLRVLMSDFHMVIKHAPMLRWKLKHLPSHKQKPAFHRVWCLSRVLGGSAYANSSGKGSGVLSDTRIIARAVT